MSQNKVKISQKEIDDIYEIEDVDVKEIKEDKQPEPEFLTKEEEEYETSMYDDLPKEEEK